MKKDKNDILLVALFALLLLAPVLAMNREQGTVSEGENRILAGLPALLDEQGRISSNFTSEFEAYLNDNIGFRNQFVEAAVDLRVNRFGLSPNSNVHIGKDGWYFHTDKYGLEIASGTHPIMEYPDALAIIAENQQKISDAYAARGIDYALVLMPCKSSVYPEYVGGAEYTVGVSPCDLLYDYMRANTTVRVVCVKDALLREKENGRQFLQQDTHWNARGAYTAYREVAAYLAGEGLPDGAPVEVTFTDEPAKSGNLLSMMGSRAPFVPETIPVAHWDAKAVLTDGALRDSLAQIRKRRMIATLENEHAADRTLLCYTDSQWLTDRNLPQLFAEHFSDVASIDTRMLDPNIEALVQPDLILYAASEEDFLDQLIYTQMYE